MLGRKTSAFQKDRQIVGSKRKELLEQSLRFAVGVLTGGSFNFLRKRRSRP